MKKQSWAAMAIFRAKETWHRHHLLDTDDLTRSEIETFLKTSETMKAVLRRRVPRVPFLRGQTVITLFYEASTRTRSSFEFAAKALGADIISITSDTSSVQKGESISNTVRTLQAVGGRMLVLRNGMSGAPYLIARYTEMSVINAGDGWHAHPTQALLDLFTMRAHLGDVAGRRIVIVGDIIHSRVAHSNIWPLTTMGAAVVVCAPPTLLPFGFRTGTDTFNEPRGLPRVLVEMDLRRALEGADVVMALRLQKERISPGLFPSVREYARLYQITEERLARFCPNAIIMHPGPMNEGIEISPAVARSAQSVIQEQVVNGVAVRMAALYLLSRS